MAHMLDLACCIDIKDTKNAFRNRLFLDFYATITPPRELGRAAIFV